MKRSRRRSILANAVVLVLCAAATMSLGAPGDVIQTAAPTLGAEAPKLRAIPDGDATVSTQTGALQYSFPIVVPPGRNEMAPKLALSYSSQGATYGGLAAGWSLSTPDIRIDTSDGIMDVPKDAQGNPIYSFVSGLAGGRRLLAVPEPVVGANVAKAYRAQYDDSYARYEQMTGAVGWRWQVKSPNGLTHYFGDSDHGVGVYNDWKRSRLTRLSDAFGNMVHYHWKPVYLDGVIVDYALDRIEYTTNDAAALTAHARVVFQYQEPAVQCPVAAGVPIGAKHDFRDGTRRHEGSLRLDAVQTEVYDDVTADFVPVRRTELSYDAEAASCSAMHGPMRLLTSIQEIGIKGGVEQEMPAVTFEYGRLTRDITVSKDFDLTFDAPSYDYSLSWGYRVGGTGWPTAQVMLADMDGDGRQDRLYMESPEDCTARWQRNTGTNFESAAGEADRLITLPTMGWANGLGPTNQEHCSLAGQFSQRQNVTGQPQECPNAPQQGSYLAYRFMDMNGDALPELIASIHADPYYYDPNAIGESDYLGMDDWPLCFVGAACVSTATACMAAAQDCESLPPPPGGAARYQCVIDPDAADACMDTGEWGGCDKFLRSSFDGDLPIPPGLPGDVDPCKPPRKPHEMCEQYVWLIYWNQGNGQFSGSPDYKLSPVPLESGGADAGLGSAQYGFNSEHEGFGDIDGDGYVDAYVLGEGVQGTHWQVFRGDGQGNFLSRPGGKPWVWQSPNFFRISAGSAGKFDEGDDESARWAATHTTTLDVNSDGLQDLVAWGDVFASGTHTYFNTGTGFMTGPVADPPSGATQFWLGGAVAGAFVDNVVAVEPDWVQSANRVTTLKTIDFDQDGRVDLLRHDTSYMLSDPPEPEPASARQIYMNSGATLPLSGIDLADENRSNWKQVMIAAAQSTPPTWASGTWRIVGDFMDLDGNGTTDTVYLDPGFHIPIMRSDPEVVEGSGEHGMPMRLLNRIDNGVGGTVAIRYASSHDSDVVTHDAAARKTMPNHSWVVRSIQILDEHNLGLPVSTEGPPPPLPPPGPSGEVTTYAYQFPVWNQDDEGKWGFRGFEEVDVTDPAGAIKVERYGYDVDWSGRLVKTEVYADSTAHDGSEPSTMSETEWEQFTLFSGAVKTFHPSRTWQWTCSPGQTVTSCRSSGAVLRTINTWSARPLTGEAVLYIRGTEWMLDQMTVKDATDWRRNTTFTIYNDPENYRLRANNEHKFAYDEVTETWTKGVARTRHLFDALGKVETKTDVFLDETYYVRTQRGFDMTTGNLLWIQKPQQFKTAGPKTTFTYDPRKLFVVTTTNEKGHVVYADHDRATGAVLSARGPNSKSCGSSCTKLEETRTTIDAFGRAIEGWVSIDDPVNGYVLSLVSRTTYDDLTSPQKVTEEKLIDFGGSNWVTTERVFDGHGRPKTETTKLFSATLPDATVSYRYDVGGRLVEYSGPDPSTADGMPGVTYKYLYDSLGRPTGMRRPDGNGVNLHYSGLVKTRAECAITPSDTCEEVAPADDVLASTRMTFDVFGRLRIVEEATGPSTWATTLYDYDINDNMTRILNEDDVETFMEPNWAGWRERVTRAGREWLFTYDDNGNMVAERLPYPAGADPLDYTNSVVYDVLDRPTSRVVASMATTPTQQSELAIGAITSTYDEGENGIGRLSHVATPVLDIAFTYDAQGRAVTETRSFDLDLPGLALSDARTTTRTYNALGAEVDAWHADDSSDPTHSKRFYDRRGLPLALSWERPSGTVTANQLRSTAGTVFASYSEPSASVDTGSYYFYDPLGRVTTQSVKTLTGTGTTVHAEQTYVYGVSQELLAMTSVLSGQPQRTFDFDYDWQHQLVAASDDAGYVGAFGYSGGGRVSAARVDAAPTAFDVERRDVYYEYDGSPDPEAPAALIDIVTDEPVVTYGYDLAGNVSSRWQDLDGTTGTTFYVNDGDAVRRATGVDASNESYYYGAAGSRLLAVRRTPAGAVDRVRFWFGETEIWYDGTGAVTKRFVNLNHGMTSARIERVGTSPATLEWTHANALGHTLVALSEDGSTVNAGFSYGPFGELLEAVGSSSDHLRRFNGKEHDQVSGLHYYGYRYYDPLSLLWTQADPLYRFVPDAAWEMPRRAGLYAFTLNNPLRYVDPNGLCGIMAYVHGTCASEDKAERMVNEALDTEEERKKFHAALKGGEKELEVWLSMFDNVEAARDNINKAREAAERGDVNEVFRQMKEAQARADVVAFRVLVEIYAMAMSVKGGAGKPPVGLPPRPPSPAGGGGAGGAAGAAEATFEILNGVRRSKAAEIAGQTTIEAEIEVGSRTVGTQTVALDSLRSPKETISTAGAGLSRWLNTLQQTLSGSKPPPIRVTPGSRGTPIRDVTIE